MKSLWPVFRTRHARLSLAATFLCTAPALSANAANQKLDPSSIEPFMEAHCFDCHDDVVSEGDLDLFNLEFNPNDRNNLKVWELVFDRVRDGEMPPKKKPRPDPEDKSQFLAKLKTPLLEIDRADLAANGRVNGRRLTRVQYENTLHDLLGIDIPLINELPADETGKEFQTVADAQQLSLFHLNQYLSAADLALENAFVRAINGDTQFQKHYGPKQLAANPRGGNYRGPEARDGKIISWPHGLQFSGRMTGTNVPESGWYQITIKNVRAINPGPDQAVWGSLRSGACSSDEPILYYVASVEATKKPATHQYIAWIKKGHVLEFKPNEGTNRLAPTGAQGGNISYRGRNLEKEGYSGIEFESIELKRVYPNTTADELRTQLLPGIAFDKDGKPNIKDPKKELHRLIRKFASRAFRRPVSNQQLIPYQNVAVAKLQETGKLHKALHAGFRAILCSPRFLTFVESPGKLDDHAVASRLSYLLWNSMPDANLRSLADRGELLNPDTLNIEVNRLLDDPKSARFIAGFTDQWLNLKEIDFTSPDRRRFRDFDPIVQDSLVQETRAFLSEIIENNLSIRNFIRSDFALLNTRLKSHYTLPDANVVPGKGLQRVSLNHPYRTGLITQGSILKVTADGSVTSPILRGIFVNEKILGLHVPPPPANVPAVEPDIRGATSIRDQLNKHSADASCAACHAKIDPAGYALESFDPVGQWRTKYGTSKDAAVVDPSGITPEGQPFADIVEWQKLYHEQPALLTKAFTEQFLTYATGASIRFSDRNQIYKIVESSKKHDYGLRSIIQSAVSSDIFLTK
ncbi:MAG: DUF1592 domain-containing protein [Verrucomicrobiota bacterium]